MEQALLDHKEGVMNTKKIFLSALFTLLLVVPTVLGAVPLTLYTPIGTVSTEVSEAEARNRNTGNNRLSNLRVTNAGARRVQSFSPSRNTYRVDVRQSTTRADIVPTRQSGQSVRHRIDTRQPTQPWRNGNFSSWRTGSNANNRIRVNIRQGQERRVRLQVRDANGNIRTITINIRRASGNTWGAHLSSNAGEFNRAFARAITNYTLTVPRERNAVSVSLDRAHNNAQMRTRIRTQNANGTWGTWSSWTGYRRIEQTRNLTGLQVGRPTQVAFQIRGAFTNMPNTPTRTRTYTVTVIRSEHTSAQTQAMRLLNTNMGFSRQMLIGELVWMGFTQADAAYAADNVGANWNAQAVLFARFELSSGFGYSRQMLIEEMMWAGFTQAQAIHGADNAGANWNEQAVIAARFWISIWPSVPRQILIDILVHDEGFTLAQATHAANTLGVTTTIAPLSSQVDSAESVESTELIGGRDISEARELSKARRQEVIGR